MSSPSAVPPDPHITAPAAPGEPGLEALIRLPPGPARQAAITRIVAGLAAPLAALHEAGQVHGGICPAAVGGDPSREAVLATPPVAPAPDAEDAPRQAGYAAFEQYTDDPAYPCGPWTDVYGVAALAYFLATGSAPSSALARRVRDDYVPLADWGGDAYGKAFCDAVDSGLAMPAHARPATVAAFAAAMGALQAAERTATLMSAPEPEPGPGPGPEPGPEREPEPEFELEPTPTDEPAFIPLAASPTDGRPADDDALARSTAGVLTQAPPEIPVRRRRMSPLMLVMFALLLAGGGYAWVRMTTPPVQLAGTPQTSSPSPARAPEVPPAAPPVGPEASPQGLPQTAPQTAPQAAPQAAPQTTPPTTPPVAAAPAPAAVAPVASVAEPIAEASSSPEPAPEPPSEAGPPGAGPAAAAGTSDMPPPSAAVPPTPPKAAPVVVRVAVRPWGEVLVNGRSRGVSPPLRELSLAPGRYQVTVRNASAGEHSMTLSVAPNRPAVISHEFK
ncbi:hypothetical protein [Achromobacter marplatensis]|uniref:hypothetical protein n=1 Tax=Achromobacter marplatensis TaxID=470868 RepID=UPI0039F7336D